MWDLLIGNPYSVPIHARQNAEDYIKLMTSLPEHPAPSRCRLQTRHWEARETDLSPNFTDQFIPNSNAPFSLTGNASLFFAQRQHLLSLCN